MKLFHGLAKPYSLRPDVQPTIYDARNPAMPWIPAETAADNMDDIELATSWADAHRRAEPPGPHES